MLSHVRVLIKPLSSKYGVLEYPDCDRKTSRALFCKRNLGANETLETKVSLWLLLGRQVNRFFDAMMFLCL